MNAIESIIQNMEEVPGASPAIVHNGREISYEAFLESIKWWRSYLSKNKIGLGTICGFIGEFSEDSCALIFALMLEKCILVPFSKNNLVEHRELYEIAGVEYLIDLSSPRGWGIEKRHATKTPHLVTEFRKSAISGLVVFSSGSTGRPKGILHNCELVAKKFLKKRAPWRTVMFLMPDHFGGFNTFLSSFAYGGTAICLEERSPEAVCRAIESGKATLLPTTPTFLNFLHSSRCYQDFDLSSIRLITYGTEVMPEYTLKKTALMFPGADVKQTYGLSELGVLRSKSAGRDSLWIRVGGAEFDVKVKDNILYIKSDAQMVGYLNAPDPFDEDGWFCTGDEVEVDGDYIRIIGRRSDMINVGGQKVFPGEVETIILEDPNVIEVAVYGDSHPTMGRIVSANIALHAMEDLNEVRARLRRLCSGKLAKFKIPIRFNIVEVEKIKSDRYKKKRDTIGQ